MNEQDIDDFAREHASALAEGMTRLCGKVIAKGLQGVLKQCLEMQYRINELEAALMAHGIPLYRFVPDGEANNGKKEQP